MDKEKIILFDIDYTLFDVGYFDTYFHQHLANLFQMSVSSIKQISYATMNTVVQENAYLDIDQYLTILLTTIDKKTYKKEIEDFLFHSKFFKGGIYKEVEHTFQALEKIAKLGLFSQGDTIFQQAKVAGLRHYFQKELEYIHSNKLNLLQTIQQKHKDALLFFVDDRPEVIAKIKKEMPSAVVIWIKRGKYAQAVQDQPVLADATIDTIDQILGIIRA